MHDFADVLWAGSAVVFLVFYFLQSRFAWHALAVNLMVAAPIYMFFAPSWRLQRAFHPGIIWFPVAYLCVAAIFLFWSRRRYVSYLTQRGEREGSERGT